MERLLGTDAIAFYLFIICIGMSAYIRYHSDRSPDHSKAIRKKYRRAWVEAILSGSKRTALIDSFRNNLMITVGLISAIVISFGFVVQSSSASNESAIADLRVISIVCLMFYALFMLIIEARTITYLPVLIETPEELIQKFEGKKKVDYLSELMGDSYDNFSNSIRAIFYMACLLVWFYNMYFFMLATIMVTVMLYREDFSRKGRISFA